MGIWEDIAQSIGQNQALHAAYINPQFAKVLATIGMDKNYQRAEGPLMWDEHGHEYLDFLAGYGVFAVGRNHPRMKQVLKEFIGQDAVNLVQMEAPHLSGLLAKQLVELIGISGINKVFFTNSGTEAVEGALKFAKGATGRPRLCHLVKSFHGLTLGSLSINGGKEFREGFGDLLPGCVPIPQNDLVALEAELKQGDVAAFIFEPIQGKGVYVPDDTFLPEAQRLCRKYGALFIADEIQTGLGRTGKWFGYQHWGLEPDIITVAKALSGGMVPVGAIIYREDIYQQVYSRMDRCVVHSSTFGQNNLAMICGLAALEIIKSEHLVERAAHNGKLLFDGLVEIANQSEWIHNVRGKGLMLGIEFGKPNSTKNKVKWNMVHSVDKGLFGELIVMPLFRDHRILTQVSGHHQDIVKLLPPLCIDETHLNRFLGAFGEVVSHCGEMSGDIWRMGKNILKQAVANKQGV